MSLTLLTASGIFFDCNIISLGLRDYNLGSGSDPDDFHPKATTDICFKSILSPLSPFSVLSTQLLLTLVCQAGLNSFPSFGAFKKNGSLPSSRTLNPQLLHWSCHAANSRWLWLCTGVPSCEFMAQFWKCAAVRKKAYMLRWVSLNKYWL